MDAVTSVSEKIDAVVARRTDEGLSFEEQILRSLAPLSAGDVAEVLGVSERQVMRYRKAGQLKAASSIGLPPRSEYAVGFRKEDVLRFVRERE